MTIEHIAPLVWAPVLAGMQKSCMLTMPRPALNNMTTSQLKKELKYLQYGLEFSESVLSALSASFELMYKSCPRETDECISTCMLMSSAYITLIRKGGLENTEWFKPKMNNIKQLIVTLTKKVNKLRVKKG